MKEETARGISLDGSVWEVGRARQGGGIEDITDWYPAYVPGEVRLDLLRAGVIEDPYFGLQNEASRWVEGYDWWYRREFSIPPDDGRRTLLVFTAVDYECDIFLNGKRVASHTGMFSPIIVDVTRRVAKENVLCVRIAATSNLTNRVHTLKCQMSFGWDFAPEIRTMGIWDSVYLVRPLNAFIKNIAVDPIRNHDGSWLAAAELEVDCPIGAEEIEAEAEFTISGANFKLESKIKHKIPAKLRPGIHKIKALIPIKDPKIWDIWEEGKQNLYTLDAALRGGKKVFDTISTRFGLRTIHLLPNEGNPEHLWTFEINRRRKFIRGANWVPADSFFGGLDADRYRALLEKAREANINMLRVWGGGLKEKQVFYDICDELGILVWQEFPFACPHSQNYPASNKNFMALVQQEAEAITLACRNHPSVAMFCGGNEFSRLFNRKLCDEMERIVGFLGGGRPYKPTSPTIGEHHRYIVFHSLGNISEYLDEECAFFSEFGLQSAPCRESLERFIPIENLWPVKPMFPYTYGEFAFLRAEKFENLVKLFPDSNVIKNTKAWVYHNAQLLKLDRYAKQAGYSDLDTFIEATQKMQAHALQVAIEHIRRRRMVSSGVMFWQFNEPWPAICWSIIDYYLTPKPAWHKLKELYSPLLASLEFAYKKYNPGDTLEAKVFVLNDRHKGLKNVTLRIAHIADGEDRFHTEVRLPEIGPDSKLELEPISFEVAGENTRIIECTLEQAGKVISRNSYDLMVHDAKPTPGILKFANNIMEMIAYSQ